MDNVKPLKCPNCGGNINRSKMVCEYCGTQFKKDIDPNVIRIETFHPQTEVLRGTVMLSAEEVYLIGKEDSAKMATEVLADKLAQAIAPFMEIHTQLDPKTLTYRFDGRVRVLRPDYRF